MGQAWVSVKGASFQKFQETACRDLTALNENPGCGAERQTPLCRGAALYATRPSRGLRESRSLSASSLMEMVYKEPDTHFLIILPVSCEG